MNNDLLIVIVVISLLEPLKFMSIIVFQYETKY